MVRLGQHFLFFDLIFVGQWRRRCLPLNHCASIFFFFFTFCGEPMNYNARRIPAQLRGYLFFVVIVSLYFSVVVSRHRKNIEKLVEEVALLDADVRALRESTRPVAAGEVVPRTANQGGSAAGERRLRRH